MSSDNVDVNAGIDMRVNSLVEQYQDKLTGDVNKQKSQAFTVMCMSSVLGLSIDESFEFLTDGGNDEGIDGLHIGSIEDSSFIVTLFQAKYKVNDMSGSANFPQNAVDKAIQSVKFVFNPEINLTLNEKIKPKIEEIRSLIYLDGHIPVVRVVLCSNGQRWTEQAQERISQSRLSDSQVEWEFFNHNSIVDMIKQRKPVKAKLRLSGKAIIEDYNFKRVLIGKIPVSEIAELFEQYGEGLLERNIRKYLGLDSNIVNSAIHKTLRSADTRENFYFLNNGITMICSDFMYSGVDEGLINNVVVHCSDLQIVNGGQTCRTIQKTIEEAGEEVDFKNAYVMVRLYELADESEELVNEITFATNSQNPVEMSDLKANDETQQRLEIEMKELGYTYKRKRDVSLKRGENVITSKEVAKAVLAVWRMKPHLAKFRENEHFGKYYDLIFKDLNAAQAILAVKIVRYIEKQVKKKILDESGEKVTFFSYGLYYLATIVGSVYFRTYLKKINKIMESSTNHENLTYINLITFLELNVLFDEVKNNYFFSACDIITIAVNELYGKNTEISLQQLAATFRRGDLLNYAVKGINKEISDKN